MKEGVCSKEEGVPLRCIRDHQGKSCTSNQGGSVGVLRRVPFSASRPGKEGGGGATCGGGGPPEQEPESGAALYEERIGAETIGKEEL